MGESQVLRRIEWAVVLICLLSLILGASFLEWMLPGGVPLGNVMTALMFICMSDALRRHAEPGSHIYRAAVIGLMLGVLWYPVSIWLAGNLTNTFSGANPNTRFLFWTGLIAVWNLGLGLWTLISSRMRPRT